MRLTYSNCPMIVEQTSPVSIELLLFDFIKETNTKAHISLFNDGYTSLHATYYVGNDGCLMHDRLCLPLYIYSTNTIV